MTNPPPYPDTGDDTGTEPDHASTGGTPHWVKVFGIIGLVLILLLVVLQSIGGGGHGPGRHLPSGDAGGYTPPSSITEVYTQHEGDH